MIKGYTYLSDYDNRCPNDGHMSRNRNGWDLTLFEGVNGQRITYRIIILEFITKAKRPTPMERPGIAGCF